jgi:uncharacterized membrane protein
MAEDRTTKTDSRHVDFQTPPESPAVKPSKFVEMVQIRYDAPIPPPGMMAEYERVQPGSVDRIISMAESQANHRQSLESRKLNSDIANEGRGQNYAFILSLVAMLGGIFLIWQGKDVYGFILLIATLVTLAGVFIGGRYSQTRERRAQMAKLLKALPQPHVKTSEREENPDSEPSQ